MPMRCEEGKSWTDSDQRTQRGEASTEPDVSSQCSDDRVKPEAKEIDRGEATIDDQPVDALLALGIDAPQTLVARAGDEEPCPNAPFRRALGQDRRRS